MTAKTKRATTIDRALNHAKITTGDLARALGVSDATARLWRKKIPAERVVQIERVTGYPRHKLRPDLYQYPGIDDQECEK